MTKEKKVVFTYSLGHFMVDFACAFLIFRMVYGTEDWHLSLLLYNFCAFALQMPFGLLADRLNRNAICAGIGCGLVALAYGSFGIPIGAAMIAGVGNGLFHIGGGIDVLHISNRSPKYLGVFVSPGAIGIYLGTMFGKQGSFPEIVMILGLLLSITLILTVCHTRAFLSENMPVSFDCISSSKVFIAVICLFLVVCMRSYIGMILSFPWKTQGYLSTILVIAVAVGKLTGGFLAQRLGVKRAAILSLGLSTVFFMFSDIPVLGVLAMLTFNMTMPITLWAVAKLIPGAKGFSFGLLTFGLFLGFLPSYLECGRMITTFVGFAFASFLSLILLLLGLRRVVD